MLHTIHFSTFMYFSQKSNLCGLCFTYILCESRAKNIYILDTLKIQTCKIFSATAKRRLKRKCIIFLKGKKQVI